MADWLSPDRWRVVSPHLERALDVPDEERGRLDSALPATP
jgi:hypothetical protein